MVNCAVCGKIIYTAKAKRTTGSLPQNSILFMSLALAGHMDMELARKLLDPATKKREYVCQRHVVQAAQFLLAEMAMLGSRIRHFDDPSASGRTAYVAFVDIPQSIVHNLNYASDEAVVKTRDVGHFLNDTLRRYYATKLWPVTDQVDVEESPCGESKHDAGEEAHDSKVSEEELTDSPEEDSGENADDPDFNIDDESESDSPIASCLGETDEDVSNQYFLVKGVKLLELFQFCPRCGNRLLGARLKAVGTAAVVKFACEKCRNKDKMWESQERTVSSSRERMHKGNVEAVVSAVTTGLRYQELADWAQQTNLSIFSKTFFFKVFAWARAAIERVYLSQQNHVLETVKDAYEESGGLHLIVDGNVDSREHSELIGKVMLVEARTELVLHTEALHLPEIGGTTTRLEIEGLRRLLAWTQARGLHVGSVTTDRSKALRAALREMEPEIGDITHYYYGKRLVKWLDRELKKAAKLDGCGGIGPWIEKLKTHLLSVIKHGAVDGTDVKAAFNTCLMHVRDVHQWPMDVLTGPYTRCAHESLEEPLPKVLNVDSKAYKELRKVFLTRSFQKDLQRASPFEGTSINEAKNVWDRIYCRKGMIRPFATYPLYVTMTTMHTNTLQLAKLNGEGNLPKTCDTQRKRPSRKSNPEPKSAVRQLWRDLVFDEVVEARLLALQGRHHNGAAEGNEDFIAADENDECEL